ncbi:PepSY domain-containing protein [Methylobacterium sp. WL8]|uniref:PepSY domain-containing protein n=1 Tax=Methylobacterium sp. WL8 TaxID=2603899 RepID=UPI001FF00CD6|nr:PepSY domain-containing protein [Methylobacterium sp. WL8]
MLVFSVGLQGVALAGQPGPDWMPVEQVKQKLMLSGYTSIIKIEAEDGHWDGEGMKNGKAMQFDLDPKTGEILGEVER